MIVNQPLFDALTIAFRDVGIVQEGEARRVRYSPDYSRRGNLKAQVIQHGEGYTINCPFCGDSRQRLTVNHHFGVRDPKTRSRNHHLWHCFNDKCHKDKKNGTALFRRLSAAGYKPGGIVYGANALRGDSNAPKSGVVLPQATIPLHLLSTKHPACQYLMQRGFDPIELAIRWGVGYCEDSPDTKPHFSNRIVIPIYAVKDDLASGQGRFNVTLAGWQARAIEDAAYDRKYLFQRGLQTSRLLYGLNEAIHIGGPLVLCEGVTDCWRIGPGALAVFGKRERLSRDQIHLLHKHCSGRPIVILFDRDAQEEANGLQRQLRSARSGTDGDRRVVVADLPEGRDDPGDANRNEIEQVVAQALGNTTPVRHNETYVIFDGARRQLKAIGLAKLGETVAVAYVNDDKGQLIGTAIAGEDRKLRYVATGCAETIQSLGDRHRIYRDAVNARVSELHHGLTQTDKFDDIRTMQRLVAHASPQVDPRSIDTSLLNIAQAATTSIVRSGLTEVAETRAAWDSGVLRKQISDLGLDRIYREIELPVIDATAAMMTNGIRIDVKLLQQRHEAYTTRIRQIDQQMHDLTGIEIDLNDDNAIAGYLYDELGLEIPHTTRSGQASVDKHALRSLSGQNEAVPLIIKYRQNKVLADASGGLLREVDPSNQRVYCHLDPLGAATGRFTCERPNLQGLPRPIRDVLVADEGHYLIEADFSQIELRVLAHISKDPALIDAFSANADLHRRTASLVFDIVEDKVTDMQRDVGKRINFAIIYGETEYGLARDLGVSQSQADEFIDRYFDGYAGVQRWITTVHTATTDDGYVTTLYGRRRHLPDAKSSDQFRRQRGLRQAVNTIIQGTAADINKMAIVRLHRQLPSDCKMLLTVHDSILLSAPKKAARKIAANVKQIMEADWSAFSVPIAVDVRFGRNWGNLKWTTPIAGRSH